MHCLSVVPENSTGTRGGASRGRAPPPPPPHTNPMEFPFIVPVNISICSKIIHQITYFYHNIMIFVVNTNYIYTHTHKPWNSFWNIHLCIYLSRREVSHICPSPPQKIKIADSATAWNNHELNQAKWLTCDWQQVKARPIVLFYVSNNRHPLPYIGKKKWRHPLAPLLKMWRHPPTPLLLATCQALAFPHLATLPRQEKPTMTLPPMVFVTLLTTCVIYHFKDMFGT